MRGTIPPLPHTSENLNLILVLTGYELDDWDSGVRFPSGLEIFLFEIVSRPALGPSQSPIHRVPGALSPGCEADHSLPSSAEVKECVELLSPLSQYVVMAWCLVKDRDNLTFNHVQTGSGSTEPPIQWVSAAPSPVGKAAGA
jgi:hypothetical protein